MRLGSDGVPGHRVVHHEVRIGPNAHDALAALEAEHARRRGADHFHPSVGSEMPADHAAVVQEVDAILDAGQAVRDLAEVSLTEILLAMEVERAMVGADDL